MPVSSARSDSPSRKRARALAAVLLTLSLAPLLIGARLHPDPAGMGTHQQLGLSACKYLATTGRPCATCGMTTAFAHAAHGQLFHGLYVQPMGAVAALLLAIMALLSAYALVRGLSLMPLLRRGFTWRTAGAAVLLLLVGWFWRISIS